MKILTVVSHPRTDSLTFKVKDRFVEGLKEARHETEVLDLHRSNFNPVLWEADEPNWSADVQRFSPEVETEIERMKKHDASAYIFPLWWWNMPAMLKGYIDRVWNYGFAYGSSHLPHQQVLWLGLAGVPVEGFQKRNYDQMIAHYFNVGLADYVGIPHSKVELLYETIDANQEHVEQLLSKAFQLGLNYGKD